MRSRALINFALVITPFVLVFAMAEAGVWFWLTRRASDDQLLKYGTLEQNAQRFSKSVEIETVNKQVLNYVPHRYIGYIPAPNLRRGKNFHNSLGFRGPEIPMPKPEGEFRIFCMGGSTTYTTNVEDPMQAYPAQLEVVLKEKGYSNVRVINAGGAGWTSYESLGNFLYRIRDLAPDMVIDMDGINDAGGRLVYPYTEYRGDNSGFLLPATMEPHLPFYMHSNAIRSLLIRLNKAQSPMSLHMTMGRFPGSALYFHFRHQYATGTYPTGVFDQVTMAEVFAHNAPTYLHRNLTDIVRICRAENIQPVLLTSKISPELTDHYSQPDFAAGVIAQNETIRILAQQLGVPLCDFAELCPSDQKYFADAIHFNELGARLQAEIIANFLLEQGLVKKS